MVRWKTLCLTTALVGVIFGCASQNSAPPPCDGRGMSSGMTPGMGMAGGAGPRMGMGGGAPTMGMGGGGGMMAPGAACALSSGPLSKGALDAAHQALADEHRAESLYAGVIGQFGDALPFARVRVAEQRHIAAIEALLRAHGEDVPAADSQPARPPFASLADACRSGVESERANIAMYDALLRLELSADQRCVFEDLRAASRDRHLPAFQRCGS